MELTELVPPPAEGRVFEQDWRIGLADAAPSGRVRLDAIARWLQDVAYADVDDAGVADLSLWVVRRMRIKVQRFPRFGDRVRLRTWGSAMGRMWAERRTSIAAGEARVETAGLWVHLDPQTRRPVPLAEPVHDIYAPSALGRVVKARLRHPAPPDDAAHAAWRFRASDLDMAEHVNNAAYWEVLEERIAAGPEPQSLDAEIEFRDPAQAGEATVLAVGGQLWITSGDGVVHASIVIG